MGCTSGGRRLVGRVQGNVKGGTQNEITVAQSYGLFGQDTEIICEIEIVKKTVKALLILGDPYQ